MNMLLSETGPAIARTDAIVLRVIPHSETSLIVTWFSEQHARLTTLIKGALRPKSAFLGQVDHFYTCELLFYEKNRGGLHIAKECCALKTRTAFRHQWRASACASYCCDLLARLSFSHDEERALYHLLDGTLDALAAVDGSAQLLFWFELHLARELGCAPRLDSCASCGRAAPLNAALKFSIQNGGVLCRHCRPPVETDDLVRLTPDVLAILRSWMATRIPRTAVRTRCTTSQQDVLRRLLGLFYNYHLDINPLSRYKAMDLLAESAGTAA